MANNEATQSYEVKNLDTGESFYIDDVDRYCKFDEFDTFSNGGVPFEVKMCGNNKITTSQGSFTVYEMEVMERKGGGRKWQLAKRYSDFNDLHEVLSDAGYAVGEIKKALPPKRWFGNLEGDVIMFRQRALERYLTMCLQCASPDDCSAVMQFLNTSTIPVSRNPNKNGPLPITPPSQSIGSDLDMYNSTTSRSNSVDVGGSFEPRSMNDEERALSNMLTLSNMGDDGAPTPLPESEHGSSSGGGDGDLVTIRKAQLSDLLAERETLYAEMQRYKDENTMLFRDLGSAEDRVEELDVEVERLKGLQGGEGGDGDE